MVGLTSRQLRVYRFIARYSAKHGESPTYREIASGLGLRCPGVASDAVDRIQERGWCIRTGASSRNIVLVWEMK